MDTRSFVFNYNKIENQLKTTVEIAKAFDPKKTKNPPLLKKYNAIWDTGATNTVISEKIIDECGLKPIGMAVVHTSERTTKSKVYIVNIMLPLKIGFPFVQVTKGKLSNDIDVLIGMDIITRGDFAVTNKNWRTTFSFRIPSILCIEFKGDKTALTETPIKRIIPKVGRNDLCPCGSGKKYKNCHGKLSK